MGRRPDLLAAVEYSLEGSDLDTDTAFGEAREHLDGRVFGATRTETVYDEKDPQISGSFRAPL